MATYLRRNAWNNGGDFSNPDLLWYAKGVGEMMGRAINDPASWWFYAAIHGEYVSPHNVPRPPQFPGWAFITPSPQVPTTPLPSQSIRDLYWNQCQHGSWYFFPWHRGYLMALEKQLRQDIVAAGGQSTWALPYWNYFGGVNGSQYVMPPAFAAPALPDGTANPLLVNMRYGPDADRNIYVPCPPAMPNGQVNADAMTNDLFTGTDANTPPPGFGGPVSSFEHTGSPHGNFEGNPHDLVHGFVGGGISDTDYGLMSDPGTAALDPIFYLHHCNIDRMWAWWNRTGGVNPSDPSWLNGPTRQFVMPAAGGQRWYYTPNQVSNLDQLDYTYEELPPRTAVPPGPSPMLARRLAQFGATSVMAARMGAEGTIRATPKETELLGSSERSLQLRGSGMQISLRLDHQIQHKVIDSFAKVREAVLPDNTYLKMENIRGTFDASVLSVYLHPPQQQDVSDSPRYLAGYVGLFGLRRASVKDGEHAGQGLTFVLNVTRITDDLHIANAFDLESLSVGIVPNRTIPEGAQITIGRISLYRQGF